MSRFTQPSEGQGIPGPVGPVGPQGPQGDPGLTPKYGAFQYLGTQSITDITQAYVMPFDTTDFSNDVNISNTTHINFPTAGVYNIQWSGQFTNTASLPKDIYVWLRVDGIDVPGSSGGVWIPSKHAGGDGHIIVGWNYFLQFTAGQHLELVWSASSTAVALQTIPITGSPTKPSTAALILTAQQVS